MVARLAHVSAAAAVMAAALRSSASPWRAGGCGRAFAIAAARASAAKKTAAPGVVRGGGVRDIALHSDAARGASAAVAVLLFGTGAVACRARVQAGVVAARTQAVRRLAAKCAVAPGRPEVSFVIGGPGSGKGTQCERVASEFGYTHLSAGDLLRAERKREGSALGEEIERIITAGQTVPSEVIGQLLEKSMRDAGWDASKFIIDGYPRSAEQLRGWEATLSTKVKLQHCVSLEVGREEMKRRLLGRAATSGRSDDNEETIMKRFATYEEETGPLLKHFKADGILRCVDGERSLEEVWAEVRKLFAAKDGEVGGKT